MDHPFLLSQSPSRTYPTASDSLHFPQPVHSLPAYYSPDFSLFKEILLTVFYLYALMAAKLSLVSLGGDIGGKLPYLSVSLSSRAVGMVDVGGEKVDDAWN